MKKIFIILLVIAGFTGCNDFLDVEPQDRIDGTTFYSTDEEMVIAVNGVYAAQRDQFDRADGRLPLMFRMLESRSDNVGSDHTDQAGRVQIDIFAETPGHLQTSGAWELLWNTVNLANNVIANEGRATGDDTLIERVVAEARFIRAFNYFHLVVLWGGVPLRVEPTIDFANTILPRVSDEDIYNFMVSELEEIATILPPGYDGSGNNEVGRATSFSALTLLGKVQLQRGNTTEAIQALRQVEGNFSLLSNYAAIHAVANDNTEESIFEISYDPSNGTGWSGANNLIPNSVAIDLGIVGGGDVSGQAFVAAYPTSDLVSSFDPSDSRINSTYGTGTDGFPYISKYIDYSSSNGADINLVMLRYADVLLMLAEALGEGAEAYGYINQVRARAGLADIDENSPGTFMEKLMNERRWEFAFEYSRWTDLLRLPEAELFAIMEAQVEDQQATLFGQTLDLTLTSSDLLSPIPQTEIDISNGVVEQNP